MGEIDLVMVNWARAQFALTAMYHWIFVPLTLGLSFLCAFFETLYVRTGREEWKSITKFWMTLFGINFAIGVATGIILEFEFGTNWSNYSWMVGDIFGAPLAIEGIVAFFLEATFFAVMFFGWDRVSKNFHLMSTWMVAIGSNLSALWILVANGWMQYPTGMAFNPDSARFEMQNFWEVLFSPVAIAKFTHTTSSSFMVGSLFVITISSWYLLKGRHIEMAKKSILVASVFGLLSTLYVGFNGDESAYATATTQPMKLAAYEGLWDGEVNAGLVAFGVLNSEKNPGDDLKAFDFEIKIPGALGLLANREFGSFVPGINDLVYGNEEYGIMAVEDKMERGKLAINDLVAYKQAKKALDDTAAAESLEKFKINQDYLGYGYLEKPEDTVPPVGLTFYAFHIMVFLGTLFGLIFLLNLIYSIKGTLEDKKWLHILGFPSFFLGLIASQSGWVVAEVGRQPWAIQDLLPVGVAPTNIAASNVQITFFMFLAVFTLLLIAEIRIMLKQIKIGPEGI
ncbi:cytochrome ubiquinol oxidase subunit I [Desulfosediminicola flagellatus]|uniref:cytochrome ubiquinol oxidase subunit I n=1 Tax=Desulfosediminicola flagellatus TaxID=2569541 RepID=UPI0010ACCC01|nr:cytochrome ubiquinol oxidase subunit I [Desulfosediminicola flagellatus]